MSRDIDEWLKKFKQAWIGKDVDRVMELFTDDVDYFETPFIEFENKDELREEWESIKAQEDIDLELEVFGSEEERFTVIWNLSYREDGKELDSRGVYLIKLNEENRCFEFAQYPVTPE